jgi:cobalt-zinc-cadmium efflux system outer membrane protein
MRRLLLFLIPLACAGCRCGGAVFPNVEARVAAVADLRPVEDVSPVVPALPPTPPDLPGLWRLALAHNPALREAAADVEAADGRLAQAGLYPNPKLIYDESAIGSRLARQGNIDLRLTQEIVTGGKRRLDMAVAGRERDAADAALAGRKFEVLTRLRRAHAAFAGWAEAAHAAAEMVAALDKGRLATKQLVEQAQTRPPTDLLRVEALLEEAHIGLTRARAQRDAAWKAVAAEVGLPGLAPPEAVPALPDVVPDWSEDAVLRRTLAAHNDLKQAKIEADRARLALERARAQAMPNVTVSGGYTADNLENTAGGTVGVEVPLPLWDRNQGNIRAAAAAWAKAEAAVRSIEARLARETAAAFADYRAGREQATRLTTEVGLLRRSAELLGKGYVAGSAQATFADVLSAEQGLLTARLTLAEARRSLWQAVADLQGLMQLDIGETAPPCPVTPTPAPPPRTAAPRGADARPPG